MGAEESHERTWRVTGPFLQRLKDRLFALSNSNNTGGDNFKLRGRRCILQVRENFFFFFFFYSDGSEALALLPRELWVPHPWKHSKPGWIGPWAA